MAQATFYTPDGDEIDIDPDDVVRMTSGDDEETTVIELEEGGEVTVVASVIEVAAELGLNPLDYVDPVDDEDEALGGLGDDDADDLVR